MIKKSLTAIIKISKGGERDWTGGHSNDQEFTLCDAPTFFCVFTVVLLCVLLGCWYMRLFVGSEMELTKIRLVI